MAGLTDNTNFLAAFNQLIKAVNDLATGITSGTTNTGESNMGNVIQIVNCGCGCSGSGGSGGSGGSTTPTTPNPGIDPDQPGSPPPLGFASWADYNAYKCKGANKIIDDLVQTIRNFAVLPATLISAGAGALWLLINTSLLSAAIVGLITLGLSASGAIVVLAGIFVAMMVAGVSLSVYMLFYADMLELNKDTLVCALFSAKTVEEAVNNLRQALDSTIILADWTAWAIEWATNNQGETPPEAPADWLNDKFAELAMYLAGSTEVINQLFPLNGQVSNDIKAYVSSNPVVCSECGGGGEEPSESEVFNGWVIPMFSESPDFEYGKGGIHDGTIDPGYEIRLGKKVGEYAEAELGHSCAAGNPSAVDGFYPSFSQKTYMVLLSPEFTATNGATINYTKTGDIDSWHVYLKTGGTWGELSSVTPNTKIGQTITINNAVGVTQAAITFACQTHQPGQQITGITETGITRT